MAQFDRAGARLNGGINDGTGSDTLEDENAMTRRQAILLGVSAAASIEVGSLGIGQDQPKVGFKDTPMLPGGKWHVHDGDRPLPPVITPERAARSKTRAGHRPTPRLVRRKRPLALAGPARPAGGLEVEDGAMVIKPGAGEITSKDEFGDCQLHLEFAAPVPPRGRDQGRGNSGVMFFGRYEIQVLDSFENVTYADGQAAAIYGQYPPLVNASRPPGQWQTYDIIFTAPRFKPDGSLESPAYVTMLHNGVLVHNHTAVIGAMAYRAVGKYTPHGPKGPIVLQDHGNPVRYRDIWVGGINDAR